MRTFAAETIFGGEAGEKLVETLGLSTQEMQKLRSQAQQTGKVLSGEQVQALDQTRQAWSRIKSTFTGVGRTIAVAMLPAVKQITPLVQQAASRIQALFQGLDASAVRGAMSTAIQWTRRLWSVTQTVAEGVVGVWNQFVGGLSTLWDEWGGFVVERLRITFGHIQSLFVGVAGVISGVWETLVGTLTGNWSRAWDGIKQIVTTAALTVAESITAMVESVLSTLSALTSRIPGVGDAISGGLDSAEQSVATFRDRIQEANRAAAGLQDVWSGFSGGDFGGGGAGGLFGESAGGDAEQPGSVGLDTSGGPSESGGGQQGLPSLQPIFRLVNQMPKKLTLMQQAGKKATNAVAQGFNRISTGLGKAVAGVISGKNAFKSFGKAAVRALKNVLSQLVALIPKLAIISGLKSIFGITSGGITSIGGVLTEAVPFLDSGGTILSDGIAKVHKGETVVPKGGGMGGQNVNVTVSGGLSVTMDELTFALDRNLRAKGKPGLL
jgi:phage-related protein